MFYRICSLLGAFILLVIWNYATASAPAQGTELLGTWQGKSGDGSFTEIWTISREEGVWKVIGVYLSGDKEAGSFRGKDIKFADGKLQFVTSGWHALKLRAAWERAHCRRACRSATGS